MWGTLPFTTYKDSSTTGANFQPPGGALIGWLGNFANAAFFIVDAGFNTGDANRIPSGSIITAVSAQVQMGDNVFTPDADVIVDVGLVSKDGIWNSTASGISARKFTTHVTTGAEQQELGGRAVLRIRDLGGLAPNRVLPIPNNTLQGPFRYVPIWRGPESDYNAALSGYDVRNEGVGDTFDSLYTGTIGQLAMRFRRVGSPGGNYRFELWSTDPLADDRNAPVEMLAYTLEGGINTFTTVANGALVGKDIVEPASGWQIVSGLRYHVRVTSARTTSPTNKADNSDYVMIATKGFGETTSGTVGCTGSGQSYGWGSHKWLSLGNYPHRASLPSMYWDDGTSGQAPDVPPYGGFGAASGLTAGTLALHLSGFSDPDGIYGTWVGLSGSYDNLTSALQAWVNDPAYETTGDQALLNVHFGARDFGNSSATAVSGIRLFVSWEPDNTAPTAVAAISSITSGAREPALVVFDGSGSSDPEGDPLAYLWDFGDGDVGSGVTPSHIYDVAGTYEPSLVVTDPGGLSSPPDTLSLTILPDCDWFTARGEQDWQAAADAPDWAAPRPDQDWKTDRPDQSWKDDRPAPDWFTKKDC